MQNIIYLRKILTKYVQDLHNENNQVLMRKFLKDLKERYTVFMD